MQLAENSRENWQDLREGSAFGCYQLAVDFIETGHATLGHWRARQPIHQLNSVIALFPVLFAFGHGIELVLKAYLLDRGQSAKLLRGIGHDLLALLAAAMRLELGQLWHPSARAPIVIRLLNVSYFNKQYEYYRIDMVTLPPTDDVAQIADQLLDAVGSVPLRVSGADDVRLLP